MTIADEIQDLNTNLTAAKAAVTAKGGTVGDTGLAGLATEIASIPAGGGGDKPVKFFDYNGNLVAEYTIQEAQSLSALPEAPTYDGLEFVEWTETLAYVNSLTGPTWIGATYQDAQSHGNDTVMHFYPTANQTYTLNITQDVENGVTVDWGDGSTAETTSGTGKVTFTHSYSSVSNTPYTIRISPDAGTTLGIGGGNNSSFASGFQDINKVKFVVGRCNLLHSWLGSPTSWLKELILSNKISQCSSYGLTSTGSATSAPYYTGLVIPNGMTLESDTLQVNSQCLSVLIIPSSYNNIILRIGASSFSELPPLQSVSGLSVSNILSMGTLVVPDGITSFTGAGYCRSVREIIIPASVTSFGQYQSVFNYDTALQKIVFKDRSDLPFSTQSLFTVDRGFYLSALDFTDFTQVPTVNFSFLIGLPSFTKILVPASLAESWKTATNWKNYASQIVGV